MTSALPLLPPGQDTDSNDGDPVAIQKERALALWNEICRSLDVPADVVKHVTGRLQEGFVPPVFHAYSTLFKRMGGVKQLRQGTEAPAKENGGTMVDLEYLPSMNPVTNGIATSEEVGNIIGKEDFMDAFFTVNGDARIKVKESGDDIWTFLPSSTKNVCELINTDAEMIGADVEITKVESNFGIGTVINACSTHLITRRLSRGVVMECLGMPEEDTRAIVGCTGIGKSWTLVYALQQLLLVNGACVLFFASKRHNTLACIRRDDKVYVWIRRTRIAESVLFSFRNIWALVDPQEAKLGSTEITMGERRLLFAATNEEMHFASDTLKINPKTLHYLDPFTEDELLVALPVMSPTKHFDERVLNWASQVGMLPRCLLNEDQFEYRLSIFDHAVIFLNSDKIWKIANSRGISNLWNPLPDVVFAVCANRDVGKDGVKVPIGYDGQSGVTYTERSLSVLSEYVWTELTKMDHELTKKGHVREFLIALWGAVDTFEFSKQWMDVKNLVGNDLKAGALFRTWDMKNKKFVLSPLPPKSSKPLFRKDYNIGHLKKVFDRNDLLVRMTSDCPIIHFAGPGRKVYKVTVGSDVVMPLDALAELLAAAGYMVKDENGTYVTVPCDASLSSQQEKLDFYW